MLTRVEGEGYETRDSLTSVWGYRSPYAGEGEWPVRLDEHISAEPEIWVQSACPLCGNGCGLDIASKDGRIVGVRGRTSDRTNRGRLGPKGLHAWVANACPDRLTRPLVRRNGRLQEVTWGEAMGLVAERSRRIQEEYTSLAIAFYTGGQLFLEEYYTLAVIGKGGLGTPHMDASTRLSTATATAALIESFGSDGQPASLEDIDDAAAILHVGHNPAEQHTVLWMRILDRRHGPRPPRLVVIDPRRTPTAAEADMHLAPRPGTDVAVLNGLLNIIIQAGWIDRDYVNAHTIGFQELKEAVSQWTPARVQAVTGVPVDDLRAAAQMLGAASSLVSTVSEGVYQSNQGTATAVQVNNLHLIRGLIGRPGCGVLHMHGQSAGANVHETGCAGSFPAFRNWANAEHMADLARLWNIDYQALPSWGPPTHIMQILRYIEEGSIRMLWVTGTNPAVSLPDLLRIRHLLSADELFLVVQDAFLTETAQLADVVLPAAIWGEKTGTFTNTDRTVHISHTAVSPPGEARPDLDIFLDYARRMDFRDRDGAPLIKWSDPESAFEAWKACTRGRPCDYTGITYARLSGGSGIQWPCNDAHPTGTPRLYSDGRFHTAVEDCQAYGHDLVTGAQLTAAEYCSSNPQGMAMLKPADYAPPGEEPDEEYPLWLTTGRVVQQWMTRTKTGHSRPLQAAAPTAFVQISQEDALRYRIVPGQWVSMRSRRGRILVPARVGDIPPGLVFVPFHYGYWDNPAHPQAANELTRTAWDPVSKQPHLKYAAVRIWGLKEPTLGERFRRAVRRRLARIKAALRLSRGERRARVGLRRYPPR